MADVMVNFSNNAFKNNYLTRTEVMERCPLAFKTEPTRNVSERYVLTNTSVIMDDLMNLGWQVVEAKQHRARKQTEKRFSTHMLVFQNPNVTIKSGDEVEMYPRIILMNSHDGSRSFRFMVGLYRLVCSNGLVICDKSFEDIRLRHMNYSIQELRELIKEGVEHIAAKIEVLNTAKKIELSEEQKRDFAIAAMQIRQNNSEEKVSESTITDLLTPVRNEDFGNDLFTVFNVLQEKVIKGGAFVEKNNGKKPRKMRAIKSFTRDIQLNQKLWQKMEEYIPLAEAA